MSITRITATRVACDHADQDGQRCPSRLLADDPDMTDDQARVAAAERGWAGGSYDLCPRHVGGGGSR